MRYVSPLLILVFALFSPVRAGAQEARPLVVMNLAAHPDDEDGRTLAYYRHAKDAVAYSVIYTRGEGGQNEIGPELYEALGAIRTDETERAARILGTQVYFLNFKDFGYSKHAAEAFEKWGGRDHVTARLVYLIRKLKPDVLFTNHDTVTVGPRTQHGQHQVVGISGYDAFRLASDASYHPEQLDEDGVDLWQPKRMFLRYWNRPGAYDAAVPVGDDDAELGMSYADLASKALGEHASQGMGTFSGRMRTPATYFLMERSATDAPPDTTDLAGNLPPNRAAKPELSYWIDSGRVPALPEGTLSLSDNLVVPGQAVELTWKAANLPDRPLRWRFSGAVNATVAPAAGASAQAALTVAPAAVPTVPKVQYQYERFLDHPPAVYGLYDAETDELLAAGYLPLEVAPPLVVTTAEEQVRLRPGANRITFTTQAFDALTRHAHVDVSVARGTDGGVVFEDRMSLELSADEASDHTAVLTLPADVPEGAYTVTLSALPSPTTLPASAVRMQVEGEVFEVKVPSGLHVGVIRSYDNTLEQALEGLGVEYVMLDSLALAEGRFDGLQTIVIDIRAYLVRPDLRAYNDHLLEWVERGGHLIVNYQKTFEWNEGSSDPFIAGQTNPGTFAPYPLELGRDRVTREDAPVTILQPDNVLFHAPNEITDDAWAGWVQERGLYFPSTYDDRYEELFSMSDPGEDPLRSSTLLAHYGQGTYLYTALVWYRQLKAVHPGTYALFANLVSLPLTDGRAAQ